MTTSETTSNTSAEPGSQSGAPGTAGGWISRINAFDGLFLRSEHLNRMQDYASELAAAVGAAGGPGVVEGFVVSLDNGTLSVSPGLAIDAYGQPLRTKLTVTLDLEGLSLSSDEFYWVEITRASWNYGSESVQGVLCDVPCSGGTTTQPYTAEGVAVQLTKAQQLGLGGVPDVGRRSWLAGRLFAVEAAQAGAWPLTGSPFTDQSWNPPPVDDAKPTVVRLAVLIPGAEAGWQLDVWTTRRDRGASPPLRAWQWRLGMRPWEVFIAQVLQFQALLAARWAHGTLPGGAQYIAELLRRLGNVASHLTDVTKKVSSERLEELANDLRRGRIVEGQPEAVVEGPTLVAMGIGELPPAGFLPRVGGEAVAAGITALLGGPRNVDVRVCSGQLSDVGGFIESAQHRDRIPLDGASVQKVDILLPADSEKRPLDWLAFARRDSVDCGVEAEAMDDVNVYVLDAAVDGQLYNEYIRHRSTAVGKPPSLPEGPPLLLSYPAESWAVPHGDGLRAALTAMISGRQRRQSIDAVALVSSEERRALGALRAELLASRFAADKVSAADTGTWISSAPESIVILFGPEPATPGKADGGS